MHSQSQVPSFHGHRAWLLLAGAALWGCGSSNDIQCHVSTAPRDAPADGTVSYHAAISGDAHIDSIIYKTDDGPQTISYPALPFELTVPVMSGTPLAIIATGRTEEGGNVVAAFTFVPTTGGSPVTSSSSCR